MPKILYVCHNHPKNRPGGAEQYAYELYQAVRDSDEWDAMFVAKVGPPISRDERHQESRWGLADRNDPREYYFYTHLREFNRLTWSTRAKGMYTRDWREFLEVHRPDVVHFQHSLFLGYDMVRETRRVLPNAAIVYHLHEFVSICHRHGQMLRNETNELCYEESPRRCNQCFPETSPEMFFLRKRYIQGALEHVDLFIVPSEHARRRYVDWGLPTEKVVHEDYGRFPVPALPDPPDAGRRRRIGFFGQMTPFKGVDVLLEAMKLLEQEEIDVQLQLRGANLEGMPPPWRKKVRDLLEETQQTVRFPGAYEQEQLPSLMSAVDWVIVPSIWWETGPLVIHEAKMHHRPVICSDIGSMLERIRDGVDGMHFRVGDPFSLADAIRRGVTDPELWDQMRANLPEPHSMDAHLVTMSSLYRGLLERRTEHERAA